MTISSMGKMLDKLGGYRPSECDSIPLSEQEPSDSATPQLKPNMAHVLGEALASEAKCQSTPMS